MAMQEEHIMDIALNGKNYCSAIHRRQRHFVAGALVRMRGARMFTPQMIAGSTQKEGTYHFFEMKGTALSLMVPNVGSNWNQKKDAVNTFKVLTTGGLVTHFHHQDIQHPINEAFTICTETLFSRCQGR
jgi:hypothetical protein